MKSQFFLSLLLLVSPSVLYSQKTNTADSLAQYGIQEYPSKLQVDSNVFNSSDFSLAKLDIKDVNSNFTNTSDLSWLQAIAKNEKVILIGESHYSTFIHNLRNRMTFAINEADYYPLIILEQEYSKTPFVNYFLQLRDDQMAKMFFDTTISQFVGSKDDSVFYQHIRYWNKLHPEKKIQVGFTDMEWDRKIVIDNILKPYFLRAGTPKTSIDSIFNLGLTEEFLSRLEPLLAKAKENKSIGAYPFITPNYIENVITNCRNTLYALNYDFSYYRQKGIIHNLSDENVFGGVIRNNKVILFGGGEHQTNYVNYPDGGNFFKEGSYLNYDFSATRGKTYSIMLEGLSFRLGDMSMKDMSKTFAGQQYMEIVNRMMEVYKLGLLNPDKSYFLYGLCNPFINQLIKQAYLYDSPALLVESINWNNLNNVAKNHPDIGDIVKKEQKNCNKYDRYIFITYSPLEIMR